MQERVRTASEELAAAGVRVDSEIRQAAADKSVAAEIVAASLERGADLVALGSHGRGDMLALIPGSVAQEVAAAIQVPVVPGSQPDPASDSESARAAATDPSCGRLQRGRQAGCPDGAGTRSCGSVRR